MKVLIARLNHETNTFSPIITDRDSFAPQCGAAAYAQQAGKNTAMSALIDFAQSLPGAQLITPLAAMANPSGSVQPEAYDWLCQQILDAVPGCDLILLDLHGAMVVEGGRDGEGELLQKIRTLAPKARVYVALDLHANATQKMVDHSDAIVSFKTYPHIDMLETGEHLASIVKSDLSGATRAVTAWCQLPMLSHTLRSNTNQGAMQQAVALAKAAEQREGILAVSILAGFSLADFEDVGMSVVVVANGDRALAQQVADEIGQKMWPMRADFVYSSRPLAESLREAQQLSSMAAGKPILLLDHSDNVMSGGTCDTLDVLEAALAKGLSNIAVGPICDPQAVSQAINAGVNSTITLRLGNRFPRPIATVRCEPVALQGRVIAIGDGQFTVQGPIYTGSLVEMGRSVVFDVGNAVIVITEERVEPFDLGIFESLGINPRDYQYILLKSRMYCRPVFEPICFASVECDSDIGGPTSSNYQLFQFHRVKRAVYPLNDM